MRAKTLVKIRVVLYTLWALITAWCTAMAGVKWALMGWEEQSCLIGGILGSWTGMMIAYWDKSAWKADEEEKAERAKRVDNKPPTP
jgi:hypothetical protein